LTRSVLLATLALASVVPVKAGANACEAAESAGGLILGNLTANRGCEEEPMKSVCQAFLACVQSHQTCLVGNGKVSGGRAASDFAALRGPLTFGVRRIRHPKGLEVCFVAARGQGPGEDVPSWDWSIVQPNGWSTSDWGNQPAGWLRTPRDFFHRSEQAVRSAAPRR